MSWEYAQKLGLREEDLEVDPQIPSVNTAKKGNTLAVMGRPKKKVYLKLGALATKFAIKPLVIQGLSSSFNLSGPFMRKHQIDQLHSKQVLVVQGKRIRLRRPVSSHECAALARVEPAEVDVYVNQKTVVASNSAAFITVRVPAITAQQVSPGEGIIEAKAHFVEHTNVNPALSVLDHVGPDGLAHISVLNSTDEDVIIPEGQKYGTFRKDSLLGLPEKSEVNRPARDREWYMDQFKLKESPFLQKKEELNKVVDLLEEYSDLFSHDDNYGHTELVEHAIYTEDKPPVKCRHRPLNPSIEPKLKEQLKHWINQDVIEPSSSPWSFPLVAVPKKNGKIRFVIDYRGLNKLTIKDSFPLPNIEDNLTRLSNSKVFSGIDGTGAYHVVSVRAQDREKTAFSTPWGLFQFKRMPFGLANAPATYCRLVQKVLDGIPTSVAVPYMDDCAIHSEDVDSHIHGLRRVFQAHREAGLTLQPEKCQLFRERIQYLGHDISAEGIAVPRSYTDIVDKWPVPQNPRDIRTFVGKVSYYRRFIHNFSKISAPLTDLTKELPADVKFELTPQARQAFEDLKVKLRSSPILAYPRFESPEPFILDTDWSGEPGAIGGVISQVQDGEERVIAYGARKLKHAESQYSSHKGELLAAIAFIKNWKYYLQHRPFILRTDHEALKWIHSLDEPKGMILRWLEVLANHEFKVEFRRGKKHGNADALSRTEHAPLLDTTDLLDHEIAELEGPPIGATTLTIPNRVDADTLRQYQEEDEVICKVKKWVMSDEWPSKIELRALGQEERAYAALKGQLRVNEEEVLERTDPMGLRVNLKRPCIPERMKSALLLRSHEEGGHRGGTNTYEQFIRRFYFPGAASEACMTVKLCHTCQKNQPKPKPQDHTLASVPVGDAFSKWSIDFVGPLPMSRHGHSYILTAKDCFTRWVEAFPTENMTAATVARTLEKEIFARFGIPDQIHSDQGTQFTSALMQEVYQQLGIEGTTTPAYNPKSNPVERTHRDLGRLLRACVDDHPQDWEDFLPGCLLAMRTARSQGTGFSPFAMLYGREAALPLDLLYGQPYVDQHSSIAYVNQLRARLTTVFKMARQEQQAAIQRARRLYRGRQEGGPLQVGELVWLYTPRSSGASRKLALYWTGPWEIVKCLSPVLFRVKSGSWNVNQVEVTAGQDRLRRYRGQGQPPEQQLELQPSDVDLADEFIETNEGIVDYSHEPGPREVALVPPEVGAGPIEEAGGVPPGGGEPPVPPGDQDEDAGDPQALEPEVPDNEQEMPSVETTRDETHQARSQGDEMASASDAENQVVNEQERRSPGSKTSDPESAEFFGFESNELPSSHQIRSRSDIEYSEEERLMRNVDKQTRILYPTDDSSSLASSAGGQRRESEKQDPDWRPQRAINLDPRARMSTRAQERNNAPENAETGNTSGQTRGERERDVSSPSAGAGKKEKRMENVPLPCADQDEREKSHADQAQTKRRESIRNRLLKNTITGENVKPLVRTTNDTDNESDPSQDSFGPLPAAFRKPQLPARLSQPETGINSPAQDEESTEDSELEGRNLPLSRRSEATSPPPGPPGSPTWGTTRRSRRRSGSPPSRLSGNSGRGEHGKSFSNWKDRTSSSEHFSNRSRSEQRTPTTPGKKRSARRKSQGTPTGPRPPSPPPPSQARKRPPASWSSAASSTKPPLARYRNLGWADDELAPTAPSPPPTPSTTKRPPPSLSSTASSTKPPPRKRAQ